MTSPDEKNNHIIIMITEDYKRSFCYLDGQDSRPGSYTSTFNDGDVEDVFDCDGCGLVNMMFSFLF